MDTDPDPLDLLREWLRQGTLADHFAELGSVLAGLDDGATAIAGNLLRRLDPDAVLRARPGTPALTVAVTGHGTLAQLAGPLTVQFARHGLLARTVVSPFDSWIQELGDPDSPLYAAEPDLVLCPLDPMIVFDELPTPWRPEDVERVLAEKLSTIDWLIGTFTARCRGSLVLSTPPLPRSLPAQLVDHRSRARLGAAWHEANARLLSRGAQNPAVVVLDTAPLLAEGVAALDIRQSVYARAHLSGGLLTGIARETAHLARHLTGQTKKVLAIDLDETTWGGVLGEDGPAGIEVADGHRGAGFRLFQRTVKQLAAQGVLLAAVSKNDPGPVATVLRDHPDMILRADDFVLVAANWRPKPDNLRDAADRLGLSVDSFVFVDDNPSECGLVRTALPGVAVIPVGAEPAGHADRLLREGWFDCTQLTAEDAGRVEAYRAEAGRRGMRDEAGSVEQYLRGLDIAVRIADVRDEPEVVRVAQLTLRTNQFNLTGQRLRPADVRARIGDPAARVVVVRAADRFGDNGLVGAVFLRRDKAGLRIENFVLSCRVFTRGIEQATLATILRHARRAGEPAVLGHYRPTAKNGKFAGFYQQNGFYPLFPENTVCPENGFHPADGLDGGTGEFRHPLAELPAAPDHIRLTDELGDRTGEHRR